MERAHTLIVVCPTEYGGQIEHAAEIAAASESNFGRRILISRRGAEVATRDWAGAFELQPVISPRRHGNRAVRAIRQVLDAWRDRSRIARSIRRASETAEVTVLWETSKFGIVEKHLARQILFVHNASPHAAAAMTLRDRFLFRMERASAQKADRVIVHGTTQDQVVRTWGVKETVQVPLPGDSRARAIGEIISGALCIGEVRPNKGLEIAIQATSLAGMPLRIIGKPEPDWYGKELTDRAASTAVQVRLEYLEAREFNDLLASAEVIVLPYTHFQAQSGVLARAIQLDRIVVASDLPALREQAGDYPNISFAPPGDVHALRRCLERASLTPRRSLSSSSESATTSWQKVIEQIFA